jgi:hypothetical protein
MDKNDFEWRTYINNYKDLQKAGINTKEKTLHHWFNHGKKEGITDKNINHFRHQLKTYCSLSYLPTVYFNQNEVVIHLSSNYDKSLELSKLSLQFIISYCTNIKKEKDI